MKLDEALNLSVKSIDREIEHIVKLDKDVPRSSVIARGITQLVRSGGKRVRPLMVLVGSRFGPSPDKGKLLRLAAAAEFIHAASLIHDDVIDNSPMRRGQPALHMQFGVQEAIHIGNYMSARVIELISIYSAERERYAYDLSSIATTQLCIGEYQQLSHAFDYNQTLDDYLAKSKNKTAQLIASCLKIGALAAKATNETAELLYTFGEKLGLSFQIRDDILDFTSSSQQLGKPAGSDLRQGQVTLPVLYALEDPELAPLIRSIGPASSAEEVELVLAAITASGALERAESLSQQFLGEAEAIILQLADYPAHQDLRVLLNYFAGRSY
ncbi:heptaprenyl diphosphate synthase [Paenibacillus sp. CAA11]|uniref:polyprenyl synthetase family protein n=1 Tax=Paenibacillus sp. CAA11 TaxID=1532905 RepID=UPI000D3C49BA|nr:polyprenyl synthetase family protein [Paenibacillus sp. CAA11]AWB43246.1 heptaprenyl diphosphate synthase [Paenibacillus sp. CAA11]